MILLSEDFLLGGSATVSIDLTNEHAIPFAVVPKLSWIRRLYGQFAGERTGSARPHLATIHRWATRGLRGVRLEFAQVGGTRVTSEEALQRFFDALAAGGRRPDRRSSLQSQTRTDIVDRELDRILGQNNPSHSSSTKGRR
jgi:hypothetical protein